VILQITTNYRLYDLTTLVNMAPSYFHLMYQGIYMFSTSIQISKFKRVFKTSASLIGLSASLIIAQPALATIVQFQTTKGDFQVNLYDKTTPETVKNFLAYVNAGSYNNTVITRGIPKFIVQGGGFTFKSTNGKLSLIDVPTNPAVINEPVYSNRRGTIAMAKIGGSPNSATNEWFINLSDNSGGNPQLDTANGGYTVFGEVIFTGSVDGMITVDSIAALNAPFIEKNKDYDGAPLVNYTPTDLVNKVEPVEANLVVLRGVTIIKSGDTDASLTPAKNTLITQQPTSGGGGGGGSTGLLTLLMLICFAAIGRSRR
jgi:cyclophilin family peptidyl-prolyl cis-trans isomerase